MKRLRSGQFGSEASNFRNFENRTVATSAMPIGMPGWPESASCTASMARALMAFAMSRWAAVGSVILCLAVWVLGAARNMPTALWRVNAQNLIGGQHLAPSVAPQGQDV